MKNTGRILLSFFLLSAVILGYFFWRSNTNHETSQYITDKIQLGNITQTVSANGTLNPVVLVNVGTQVTGKVQKIYADFNNRVTSGQVLLELDPTLLKTEVAQSLSELNKAQATLDLAIANENRGEQLREKNYISKQDLDQLLQARKSAEAELGLAQAKLDGDRANLDYATIRSPVSGVIVDRQVDVGQTVTASFQTPILFKIAQDLSEMQIDSSFAEADIGNIKPGQKVFFTVDAFPQQSFSGVVKQIRLAPTIQQNVVTYNVVINVENKDGILLPGMTAYVNIKTAEHKNVLLVPNAALRFKPKDEKTKTTKTTTDSEPYRTGTVYKLVENKVEPISLRLGITDSNYTEVFSDKLKAGDILIVGYTQENQTSTSSFRVKVF
ncbi:MAG: hypothetical protein ACD_21C00317G0002 [uncultured bacterium]|nr:MAG: hypothetical protein ACD_21C00317G0002 [uncultured bacterium]